MKTRIGVNTSENLASWQPRDPTAHILQQVKELTRDLHSVQNDLFRELAEEDGTRRKHSRLVASPDAGDLIALKIAADQLRRTLWFYLEAVSAANESDPVQLAPTSMRPKMIEIHESGQPASDSLVGISNPGSFFDRLNLVIDGYLNDRGISGHGRRSKP